MYLEHTLKQKRYSERLAKKLFLEIMSGRSVHSICRENWSPSEMTFYRWVRDQPGFCEQYKKAREIQSHTLMDKIPEWIEHDDNPHALTAKTRAAEIFAKRCAPKIYGDRQALEHSGPDRGAIKMAFLEQLMSDIENGFDDE